MTHYVGRFAPSPTGPLHFGSLVGALASYLDARVHQGTWLVRIEDIDPLREPPGAADDILRALEAHGLHWDRDILYQSTRSDAYEAALATLLAEDLAYRCPCSRKELESNEGRHRPDCPAHARTDTPLAIRFRVTSDVLDIRDRLQGPLRFVTRAGHDDFVLKRKEGFYAYQLAVVVDDAWQGVTHVVRGCDLLDSLPWQCLLRQSLGLPQPEYAHLPLITNEQGQKLSKQNRSPALDSSRASHNLWRALHALGLRPAVGLRELPSAEILTWAISHWSLRQVPAVREIPELQLPE